MGQNLEFVPFGRVNQPQRNLLFISQSFWPLNSNQCLCGPKDLRFSLFFGGFSPQIPIRHTKKKQGVFWGMPVIRTSLLVPIAFFEGHHPRSSKWKIYAANVHSKTMQIAEKKKSLSTRCHFAPPQRQFDGEAAATRGRLAVPRSHWLGRCWDAQVAMACFCDRKTLVIPRGHD